MAAVADKGVSARGVIIDTEMKKLAIKNSHSFWKVAAKDAQDVIKWSMAACVGTSLLLTGTNPLIAAVYMGSIHLAKLLISHITEETILNKQLQNVISSIVRIAVSMFVISMLGLGPVVGKIIIVTLVTLGAGYLMAKGMKAYIAEREEAEVAEMERVSLYPDLSGEGQ